MSTLPIFLILAMLGALDGVIKSIEREHLTVFTLFVNNGVPYDLQSRVTSL